MNRVPSFTRPLTLCAFLFVTACASQHFASVVPSLATPKVGVVRRGLASASFSGTGSFYQYRGGNAFDVGVGKNYGVYAVGANYEVWKWVGGSSYVSLGGSASRVSVSPNGVPYAIGNGPNRQVWFYGPSGWTPLGGASIAPIDIGVGGDNSIWVVGSNNQVYKYVGGSVEFQSYGGFATRIAVDNVGVPYVVNGQGGGLFYLTSNGFKDIGGSAIDVAVDQNTGRVWAQGGDSATYYWDGSSYNGYTSVGGVAANLAVGGDGLWAAQQNAGNLYQRILQADVYDPPQGTYPYFKGSVATTVIPASVTPDPSSAAWLQTMEPTPGASSAPIFGALRFASGSDAASINADSSEPVYTGNQPEPVTLQCTYTYGNMSYPGCADIPTGTVLHVNLNSQPQNGPTATGGGDRHYAIVDAAGGYEYDFWQTTWPPANGVLSAQIGGRCTLASSKRLLRAVLLG